MLRKWARAGCENVGALGEVIFGRLTAGVTAMGT